MRAQKESYTVDFDTHRYGDTTPFAVVNTVTKLPKMPPYDSLEDAQRAADRLNRGTYQGGSSDDPAHYRHTVRVALLRQAPERARHDRHLPGGDRVSVQDRGNTAMGLS